MVNYLNILKRHLLYYNLLEVKKYANIQCS